METGFGLAELKQEGAAIPYSESDGIIRRRERWVYVERKVPEWMEAPLHAIIDELLKGYDANS